MRGERGQHELRFFELWDLERGAGPFQIGVDGTDGAVTARAGLISFIRLY